MLYSAVFLFYLNFIVVKSRHSVMQKMLSRDIMENYGKMLELEQKNKAPISKRMGFVLEE